MAKQNSSRPTRRILRPGTANRSTRPAHRRHGIASGLIDALLERLRKQHARTLFLEVAEDNDAARALYRHIGFREVGRREGYYASKNGAADAVVLGLDLDSIGQ